MRMEVTGRDKRNSLLHHGEKFDSESPVGLYHKLFATVINQEVN
jgi:hypothetical protein